MVHSRHKHFMASLTILCLATISLIIRATPCSNGQHCRECDNDGDCSTPCERGYFDQKCTSECSSRCTNKSCELTARGIEICTEGCVPGFKGTSCKIPCGNPGTQCTACEDGCDGGYCRLSPTSCVSGCVDSYYGLDCKHCSERCKSCNRSTGVCDDCHAPYRGLNCEMSCENCPGSCVSGCEGGCQPGFYGHWCDKVCSENCRPGSNETLECDRNASINCLPKCDNSTGDCTYGCNVGWYGTNCSSRCNVKCARLSCTDSGACVDGCAPGYAGTDCSCYENCINNVCHPNNGSCVKGCINGYYGAFCNNTCKICLDGICDRKHGTCIRFCNITDGGCKLTCSSDCPKDVCLTNISCEGTQPKIDIKYIIIGLSAVLCLTVIMCAFYYRKCRSKRRIEEANNHMVEYQPASNRYWDINDADLSQECDSSKNESNDVIPAVAEHLQEAHDSGTHDDVSSDSTSGDNPSYTHLARNNCVDDQTAAINYITPAEGKEVM